MGDIVLPKGLTGTFLWQGKEILLKEGFQKVDLNWKMDEQTLNLEAIIKIVPYNLFLRQRYAISQIEYLHLLELKNKKSCQFQEENSYKIVQ